jgi:hypothetical protein
LKCYLYILFLLLSPVSAHGGEPAQYAFYSNTLSGTFYNAELTLEPVIEPPVDISAAGNPLADPFRDYPKLEDYYVPRRKPGYVGQGVSYLLKSRETVSSAVSVMGKKMDAYFAGESFYSDKNNTYLRLRIAEKWIEGGRLEPEFDYKFRLDLPGTKERYRLVLSYQDDNEQSLEARNRPSETAVPTNDQSLFAGLLRTLSDEGGEWETKLSAGVKVKLPPDPFVRAKGRRFVDIGPIWELEFRSSAEWFNSSGFHGDFDVIFERLVWGDRLLRASTLLDWREEEDSLEFGQVFSLFQSLSEKEALEYQVGVFGSSLSQSRINTYYLSAKYRRNTYKDWLFMDVLPELAFPRDESFSGVASITITFEIFFR